MPLSFNQESRLRFEWLARMLNRPRPPMHLAEAIRLVGPLDIARLQRAISTVVERHQVLRTVIAESEGARSRDRCGLPPSFTQTILEPTLCDLNVVSLQQLPAVERSRAVARTIANEIERPFKTGAALLRPLLVRCSDIEHVLLLVTHHLATDVIAMGVIRSEIERWYANTDGAPPSRNTPPVIQYDEFARWQHETLHGETLHRLVAFWKHEWGKFRDSVLTVDDFAGTTVNTASSDVGDIQHELLADLSAPLRRCCGSWRVTPFAVGCAAVLIAAFAYRARPALAVWVNFGNRPAAKWQQMVGWCANAHIVGVDIADHFTFVEVFREVQSAMLRAHTHQGLPWSLLWELVLNQGTPGFLAALHPHYVTFDWRRQQRTVVEDLHIQPLADDRQTVESALDIRLYDDGRDIMAQAKFSGSPMSHPAAQRLLRTISAVLTQGITEPTSRLGDCRRLIQ